MAVREPSRSVRGVRLPVVLTTAMRQVASHTILPCLKTLAGQPDGRDVKDFKQTKFDLRDVVLASRTVSNNFDSGDRFDPGSHGLM